MKARIIKQGRYYNGEYMHSYDLDFIKSDIAWAKNGKYFSKQDIPRIKYSIELILIQMAKEI